ncbi:HAMP domain-containing sensor histidine kinase [Oxalobacteraceae bacterium R-40]|uniref:histidine kinase n=1 Tax=Keguizhuia sedimenti TaxID=3064264 RepID=A0ABU1BRI3_9BURK|nr:HAMP domain-containing sensor histidine kinase [Oxalobacteraceae bacterium R-40]
MKGTSLRYAHGSERARMTKYDPDIFILEYQMFRVALLHVLAEHDVPLNDNELMVINGSIDKAIRDSVMTFSAVVAQMQEQFIAALTHDMRTPLQTASMAVEIIALTAESSQTKALARRAAENLIRVDKMAQSLPNTVVFHQGQKLLLELTNFDMMDVIKEVTRSASDRDGFRCEVIGEPAYGWWAQDAMCRSLENLVGNAVKYGDQRKPIRIAVETAHEALVLSAHNEGAPVPMEEQETTFQVFRRSENATKGDKQGRGVELPYVRAVVESLGGVITVDRTPERGTTFTITMPLYARPFQSTSKASLAEEWKPSRTLYLVCLLLADCVEKVWKQSFVENVRTKP